MKKTPKQVPDGTIKCNLPDLRESLERSKRSVETTQELIHQVKDQIGYAVNNPNELKYLAEELRILEKRIQDEKETVRMKTEMILNYK